MIWKLGREVLKEIWKKMKAFVMRGGIYYVVPCESTCPEGSVYVW